jgi:Xaa-Pro dipeptidase
MGIYQDRREKLYRIINRQNLALVMFEDTETRRDPAIRWLTGHPGDALLFLSSNKSLLVPWDINIAAQFADADNIIPYNDFERQAVKAFIKAVDYFQIPLNTHIEIPPVTPHPIFLQYEESLPNFKVLCRNKGVHSEVEVLRTIKDEEEIGIYRKVSALTNELIDLLEKNVRDRSLKTEIDVALFIEAEARKRGCEGTGFETLAAGPKRSFGIHAFPSYTSAPFAEKGLSILDFGLKYSGYTSDVTLTFVRDPSPEQEELLSLTMEAYHLALSLVKDGVFARDIAHAVDDFFIDHQKTMPHGLGHGVGLEIHESPRLQNRAENEWVLSAGMIFTIEPGLYDPLYGGCRFENDVLLTKDGPEVLTKSRIIRL